MGLTKDPPLWWSDFRAHYSATGPGTRPGQLGLRRAGWTFASVSGRSPWSAVIASGTSGHSGRRGRGGRRTGRAPRPRSARSSSFSGMSETFEGFISSTSTLGTSTTLVESSGSTRIVRTSCGLVDDPAGVDLARPSVATTEARYWSETTLLGSRMASARSLKPNRPAAWVRSGPVAPPSPAKRWQSDAARGGERPLAVLEVAPPAACSARVRAAGRASSPGRGLAAWGVPSPGRACGRRRPRWPGARCRSRSRRRPCRCC